MHICMYVCMHERMYVCVRMYGCMYACMYVRMCACVRVSVSEFERAELIPGHFDPNLQ